MSVWVINMGCNAMSMLFTRTVAGFGEYLSNNEKYEASRELMRALEGVLSDIDSYEQLCELRSKNGKECEEMLEILLIALSRFENEHEVIKGVIEGLDVTTDDLIKECKKMQSEECRDGNRGSVEMTFTDSETNELINHLDDAPKKVLSYR